MSGKHWQWILGALTPFILFAQFYRPAPRLGEPAFLPGASSDGHHQIELQCAACHSPDMGVKQSACVDCHQAELDQANDSHPDTKFLDPRNADRLSTLDVRKCVTCHREHQPDQTAAMGLTLPPDYCFFCHQDIADDRPSHKGIPFDSCATTGCHNYHDNSALYEDFLSAHLADPDIKPAPQLKARSFYEDWAETNERAPLVADQRDAPPDVAFSQNLVYEWSGSAHARSGVNCSDCHSDDDDQWTDTANHQSCQDCHQFETDSFLASRHGMRLAQGLSPMIPDAARIPMASSAAHRELSCTACHDDHSFDTRFAAVDACIKCHDDNHTQSYKSSRHFQLWLAETSGRAPPGTGVSCATCHLPRVTRAEFGDAKTRVLHNQNDTLRPNEKMIRPVCLECHGLGFSIDAQADPALLERNYIGLPSSHVESLDWIKETLAYPDKG